MQLPRQMALHDEAPAFVLDAGIDGLWRASRAALGPVLAEALDTRVWRISCWHPPIVPMGQARRIAAKRMPGTLSALDATAQHELVASREVSPRELVDAAIGRIAADPLAALETPLAELGTAVAEQPGLAQRPLGGVPFLLKDAGASFEGLPQHLGSGLLRELGRCAPETTPLGGRFRDAGLVCVGVSAMPEFGLQPTTQPILHGPTSNPWARDRSAGGSSGGAAAAVAMGLVPIAHASDIGGSIRIPAAFCGVVGLKPSRGRTSSLPIVDPNLVEHVICRSVRDAALALDLLAGPEAGDPYSLDLPADSFAGSVKIDPKPLRIGFLTSVGRSAEPPHADCVEATLRAARLLESLGHDVSEVELDLTDDGFVEQTFLSISRETSLMIEGIASFVGRPLEQQDVEPFTWALASAGALTSDAQHAQSQAYERAYSARVSAWWSGEHDVLLTPATGLPAPLLADLVPPADDPLAILPVFRAIWCFAQPFNITGQPALSIPSGRSASGLPGAVQLVAALGREDLLLALGAQLERADPWSFPPGG